MPQRKYSKEQSKVSKMNPRVILPIRTMSISEIASDPKQFRRWLDEMIVEYPNLFPAEIGQGYMLHDYLPESVKLPGVRFRRIKLTAKDESGKPLLLTIGSSDVMPYMTGYTDEVEKALFLRRFGVPFWALTYIFGRNDDYWYNLDGRFGRYEIVGTVVQGSRPPARRPAGR